MLEHSGRHLGWSATLNGYLSDLVLDCSVRRVRGFEHPHSEMICVAACGHGRHGHASEHREVAFLWLYLERDSSLFVDCETQSVIHSGVCIAAT